jgi:hypothetical protein
LKFDVGLDYAGPSTDPEKRGLLSSIKSHHSD